LFEFWSRLTRSRSAENSNEEAIPTADKTKHGKHHNQETIKPGRAKKDELGEKDLEQTSGGGTGYWSPRRGGKD
jgi:hypothetical protein